MMASESHEDLDANFFFKQLQTVYKKKFESAQEKCCCICIPKAESLENSIISSEFVDNHILVKSPILKSQYLTTDKHQSRAVEIEGNVVTKLVGFSKEERGKTVKILAHEVGYNKKSKQYDILIIDGFLSAVGLRKTPSKISKEKVLADHIKETAKCISFEKCSKFLHDNPDHIKVMKHLDDLLKQFNENYFVLPSYLTSTATKLREIIDDAELDFSVIYRNVYEQNSHVKADIHMILESYVMGFVHKKVFPIICQNFQKEDKFLMDKILRLHRITPDQLGIQEVFCIPQRASVVELASLDLFSTPLEKLQCIKNTIKMINQTISNHIKDNYSILKLSMVRIPVLTTDDIIPILVLIIIQAKLSHLASNAFYIEYFHRSYSIFDKSSFDLVTFQAAINYIKTTNFDKLKPARPTLQKELSLEELMQVTERLQQQNLTTEKQTAHSNASGFSPSAACMDKELERITKMIEASTKELQEVENLGVVKATDHSGNTSLGDLLSNQEGYGMYFGKQR